MCPCVFCMDMFSIVGVVRMSLIWLRNFCTEASKSSEMSPDLLMHQILTMLKGKARLDESSLIDLVGFDQMHVIPTLLEMRSSIVSEWTRASAGKSSGVHFGDAMSQVKITRKKNVSRISGYDDELDLVARLGWSDNLAAPVSTSVSSGAGGGPKLSLPEGTTRHLFPGYEEYRIPAPPQTNTQKTDLIPVSTLPKWCRRIFAGDSDYLNKIQSAVFQTAFHTSDNFLMCAPTGAGKTNVALLAVARLMGLDPNFTCVYMAPMKALVSEVVEKFSHKLQNVCVREFTGDVSIPKNELLTCNVIVTVPEKWDILMRNLDSSDPFLSKIQLMIIDEIHLLNDDRGAVIESIVARTMQFAERMVVPIRFVALSATFSNYLDIAQFLGVSKPNVFYFGSEFRPVPLEQTITGVGKDLMPTSGPTRGGDLLNKIVAEKVGHNLSENQQVMVFVHARNDTVKTAEALVDSVDASLMLPQLISPEQQLLVGQITKSGHGKTRQIMTNLIQSGVTIHHAGMLRPERTLAEKLFKAGVAGCWYVHQHFRGELIYLLAM